MENLNRMGDLECLEGCFLKRIVSEIGNRKVFAILIEYISSEIKK